MSKIPDLFVLSEHADLLKKLHDWDIAYHQNDAPVVDDATYDAAKKRALELEELYPQLAQNGASTHVGAAVSDKFKSFRHSVPMLSIADVFNQAEVADWFNKLVSKELFIELKVDGVSIAHAKLTRSIATVSSTATILLLRFANKLFINKLPSHQYCKL